MVQFARIGLGDNKDFSIEEFETVLLLVDVVVHGQGIPQTSSIQLFG